MTKQKIDVDANGFDGDYLILKKDIPPSGTDQNGKPFNYWDSAKLNGNKSGIELDPGEYTFHVRGNVLGCYFSFTVTNAGTIEGITSPNSAEAVAVRGSNDQLKLNTSKVTIHPAGYTGRFKTNLKSYDKWNCFGGSNCACKDFVVIYDLLFFVSNGASRGTPRVGGFLRLDGTVQPESTESANGGDHSFTLRTTTLAVIATSTGKFWISGFEDAIEEVKNLRVMRGATIEVLTVESSDRPALVFKPH